MVGTCSEYQCMQYPYPSIHTELFCRSLDTPADASFALQASISTLALIIYS